MQQNNNHWQERTSLLLGDKKTEKLSNAHIFVVGLGGVGAYAAEMLCRAGVERLTIADADVISSSNRNRQLLALSSTAGMAKTDLMSQRLLDINPDIQLTNIQAYLQENDFRQLLNINKFDYVVDAIDTLAPKVNLIKFCIQNNIPLVSSMGAGAKLDPTKVEIQDISKSHHCPLAHMLRKRLHKLGIRKGFKVVFSSEAPITEAVQLCDDEPNKKSIVGTISYLPAIFGCYCASVAIRDLTASTCD